MTVPARRTLQPLLSAARRRIRVLGSRLTGGSATHWDALDPAVLRSSFLQDEFRGINHPSRKWVRRWLLEQEPGLTLLDIPCGPGVEYSGLQQYEIPVRYIGMDLTDTMLGVARERHPDADFRKGSLLDIPMASGSVDVVLCRHILEHLDDWRPAVAEAVRVASFRVIIVLFRVPTHSARKALGDGAWDNRIDAKELRAHLDSLGVEHNWVAVPYEGPTPIEMEENVIVEVDVTGRTASA